MVRFLLSSASLSLALVLGVCGGAIAASPVQSVVQSSEIEKKRVEADRLLKEGDQIIEQQSLPSVEVFQKAVKLYQEIKDRKGEGYALRGLGRLYRLKKEYPIAMDFQKQALAIARELQETDLIAKSLNGIGAIYRETGNFKDGFLRHQEALQIARLYKNHENEANSLTNLGITFSDTKNYSEALVNYEEALKVERAHLKRPKLEASLLILITVIYQETQQYSKMQKPAEESLAVARQSKDLSVLLQSISHLANVYTLIANRLSYQHIGDRKYKNDPNTIDKKYARLAIQTGEEARSLANSLKQFEQEAKIYQMLGNNYFVIREEEKGVEFHKLALEVFRRLDGTKADQLMSLGQILWVKYSITEKYQDDESSRSLKILNEVLSDVPLALALAEDTNNLEKKKEILKIQSYAYRSIANIYEKSYEFKAAEEFAQKSLKIAEQSQDAQSQCFSLDTLSGIYTRIGKYQDANAAQRKSAEIATSLSLAEQAGSLRVLASNYAVLGNHRKAINAYKNSLELNEKFDVNKLPPDLHPIVWSGNIQGFVSLALSYRQLGEFELSIQTLNQGLKLAQSMKMFSEEAKVLTEIGNFYIDRNEFSLALEYTQKAESIISQLNQTEISPWQRGLKLAISHQLARIYIGQEKYSQAWEAIKQSEMLISKNSGEKLEQEINILEKTKDLYMAQGDIAESLKIEIQILDHINQLPNAVSRSTALNSTANKYMNLGDYQTAKDLLRKSLAESTKSQVPLYQVPPLTLLAQIELFQGNPKQAALLAEQALNASQRNSLVYDIRTYHILAQSYGELGEEAKAFEAIQSALQVTQRLQYKWGEKSALTVLASLHHRFGRTQDALNTYQAALAIPYNSDNSEIYAGLSRVHVTLNQPMVATAFYKQAIIGIEKHRQKLKGLSTDLQRSFLQARLAYLDVKTADIYRSLADLLIAQGRFPEAQAVLELLKLQELKDYTRDNNLTPPGISLNPTEQETLDNLLKQYKTIAKFAQDITDCEAKTCPDLQTLRQQRRDLNTAIENAIDTLNKTLSTQSTDPESIKTNEFTTTARAVVTAQPGTVLIYPLITEVNQTQEKVQFLLAFKAGTQSGIAFTAINGPTFPKGELNRTAYNLRADLSQPTSDLKQLQSTSQKLYNALIKPLEPEIQTQGIKHLVFASDRITRYLPMGVLHDGKDYLINKPYTITTILSASLTDPSAQPPSKKNVLAAGATQFAQAAALPYVEQEINAIAQRTPQDPGIIPGTKLLNDQFTIPNLRDKLSTHNLLHIATHGHLDAGNIANSYLLPGQGENITKQIIQDLPNYGLGNIHLVILSACNTAVGSSARSVNAQDPNNIELSGLSLYFMRGGVKSVIASLWAVSDPSTALLMQSFYGHLSKGKTKAEALRQAQLDLLNIKDTPSQTQAIKSLPRIKGLDISQLKTTNHPIAPGYTHPYYWAPFILIGNSL
jgi:CHAT domain-containing protein